jgi:hypothetical protein
VGEVDCRTVIASSIADRNLNFCQLGKATATIGFEKLFSFKILRKADFTNLYVKEQDRSHIFIPLLIVVVGDKIPDIVS